MSQAGGAPSDHFAQPAKRIAPADSSRREQLLPLPGAISGRENGRVLGLVSLIELKQAARRLNEFADVLELIRFNGLDEGYPSVRPDYIECLEEKRREGCYASRRGERDAGPEGK